MIGEFENHFRADSARALQLQCPSRAIGQLRIDKPDADLIFVARWDETCINESAFDIKANKIAVLRPESDAPEPAEALIGRLFEPRRYARLWRSDRLSVLCLDR